jgi:hypothetical protein
MRHTHINDHQARDAVLALSTQHSLSDSAALRASCPLTTHQHPDPNLHVLSWAPAMANGDAGSQVLHEELSGLSAEIHVSRSGDAQDETEGGVVLDSLGNLADSISLGA